MRCTARSVKYICTAFHAVLINASMAVKDFKLPDLGEGVHEGQVLRVMVAVGEQVREDQPLMEVETDKAAVVIPCPFNGIVDKVHVKAGQLVHVGEVMVTIGTGSGTQSGPATSVAGRAKTTGRAATSTVAAKPLATADLRQAASTMIHTSRRNPASPAMRQLARSLKIDIETIHGSGPGGRVQRQDIESAASGHQQSPKTVNAASTHTLSSAMKAPPHPGTGATPVVFPPEVVAARVAYPAVPESLIVEPQGDESTDTHGLIKIAPLSQARKTIANVMSQSWTTIPHATDFDDADVTELEKIRKGYAPPDQPHRSITLLAFVIRAVVRGLQRFPEFNASIDIEKNLVIYKRYFHIAVGVHTERGLVPMVVRHADRMSIPQISDELHAISEKARTATFSVNDTRGGTYTISNAGAMGGSRYSTPIITPPQVAVLALGRSKWMPWVVEQENGTRGLAPRLIMPLSHSIDHRLLDGGQEVQFMQQVISDLQNPARLLL